MDKRVLHVFIVIVLMNVSIDGSKLYTIVTTKLNWHGAYVNCRAQDKALVAITSAAEQRRVRQAIIDAGYGHVESFWIGGTDKHSEGQWRWMSSGKSMTYTNWIPYTQPDNAGNQEHCAEIWSKRVPFAWNDRPCDHRAFSVCEE